MVLEKMTSKPTGYSESRFITESDGSWSLTRRYFMKDDFLIYSFEKCTKGGLCVKACPKEALEIEIKKDQTRYLLFDPEKCVLCGLCAAICEKLEINALIKKTEPHIEI
ncbi:MAG: 4Fe-4S binding protein [Candidatus Hodarchaeales archaeon]